MLLRSQCTCPAHWYSWGLRIEHTWTCPDVHPWLHRLFRRFLNDDQHYRRSL